jgi:hypothetical protein
VSEAAGGSGGGRTRLIPTNIRPQIMDKIYRMELDPPELGRIFPKSSAASPAIGRRSVNSAEISGGVPLRDRRLGSA